MWWTFSSDVTVIFHVFSHKTEAATAKTIARRRPLPPHPKPPPRLRRVFVGVENFGFHDGGPATGWENVSSNNKMTD